MKVINLLKMNILELNITFQDLTKLKPVFKERWNSDPW